MNKINIILLFIILSLVIIINIISKNESFTVRTKYPIIIQTWKDNNIPPKYRNLVNRVKYLNPNSQYIFFTDNEIEIFIKDKFPQYYKTYNNFDHKIQKIDFFRYLAIYYYGGVYLDLDIALNKSLENIGKDNKCVFPLEFEKNGDEILKKQNFRGLIGNYAFYAPKNHPFMKKIINNVVKKRIKSKNKNYMKTIFYTTGPVMVTQSYVDFKNKDKVKILKPYPFRKSRFGDYGRHVLMGSWKKK